MEVGITNEQAGKIVEAICQAAATGTSGAALTRMRESLVTEVRAVNALISVRLPTIPQPQAR